MQHRFTVAILVLQSEGLVCTIRYLGFLFHTTPAGVVAEPNQVAVFIGHLTRDADLVAVEVVDLLASFASEGVAFAVAMVYEFAVFVETVYFRPPQCVGNDGMVFAVVERPFFAEVVAALENFAVVVVAEADMATVAVELGDQLVNAATGSDFGKQQPCAAVGGGDLVEAV